MSKKPPPEGALFVRLPAAAVEKLQRAAAATGMRKKDLVASLVSKYVDPDSQRGRSALGALSVHKVTVDAGAPTATVGAYSFQPYESPAPPAPPEVLNAAQAGELLQLDEDTVVALAERDELPGRKLGSVWRFSRAALIAWLSRPRGRR
ncbi:MAG TPA: helix-turn-helix domain-containing protein [Polyangia bacterium]|nr:helix-turn-helix domain-containing protein [Polyangia bacterium]